MSDPFIAEIRMFPFNFAPKGWQMCNGQILPLSQYTALFSLIGTYYGGNGTSNFALPDLRGLVAVNMGQGLGLSPYNLGEPGGAPAVTILTTELPSHNHNIVAKDGAASSNSPANNFYAIGDYKTTGTSAPIHAYTPTAPGPTLAAGAIGFTGGGLPHDNMMPYLALNFCIAIVGIFPARS